MAERLRVGFALDPHYSSHNPASRRDDFPEAMLRKTEFAAAKASERGWAAFVIAGDVFSTATLSYEYLVRLSQALKSVHCRRFAVAGNHDMRHRQVWSLPHQPYGVLREMGAFEDLVDIGGYGPLVGMHYRDEPSERVPEPSLWHGHAWLVCHQYVGAAPSGYEAGADGWLTYDDIDAKEFTGAVVGHDHAEYEDAVTPRGALVLRFGALSRGTKHEHNRERVPKLAEVEFNSDGSIEVSKFEVPAERDVFLQTALLATERNAELKGFVSALGDDAFRQASDDSTVSEKLREVAEALDAPAAVVRLVEEYLERHGIA